MTSRGRDSILLALIGSLLFVVAACSDDDSHDTGIPAATATATASATAVPTTPATPTPTTTGGAGLLGLVVLGTDVAANSGDALDTPPESFVGSADGLEFDRALSRAEWRLSGPAASSGSTEADGTFSVGNLPAGNYTLHVSKTLNGNLVSSDVPVVVGPDGDTALVVEIGRGAVRATAHRVVDGRDVRETHAPNGGFVVIDDGRVVEFGQGGNSYADPDGDGTFVPLTCLEQVWLCDEAGACGPDRRCSCTASCPFCDDCGPGVCVPPLSFPPYRCSDGGGCELPGDRCLCVSSCPDCRDCALSVCVPACDPLSVTELRIEGQASLVVGRSGRLRAVVLFDNGTQVDMTHLVSWESSDTGVLTVDSWGTVSAHAVGTASVSASLGDAQRGHLDIEVVQNPALRRIVVENLSCTYPTVFPGTDPPSTEPDLGDPTFGIAPPECRNVVRLGRSVQFIAFGEFADGTFEEITRRVEWSVSPAEIGTVDTGLFTASAEGTAAITASLDGVSSAPYELRIVAEPTVVDLSIYATNAAVPPFFRPVFEDDPEPAAFPDFCFECGGLVNVLTGDQLHFRATARYDTGEWEDVTERVGWNSGDAAVGTIDPAGVLTAVAAGNTVIDATFGGVESNDVEVRVVDEATLLDLSIFQDGPDRVVGVGEQAFFRAHGYYDIGISRDMTDEVVWRSSDDTVGSFGDPGTFTGHAAGNVEVWADLDGVQSNRLPMEVFATSTIEYCDPANVNRGIWEDGFNRVILESDCSDYMAPDVVSLRFTVTERERPAGIFDPCLDLFVFRDGQRIRTIREEGCGEPFLAPEAPNADEARLRYQLLAFWDLKDDRGTPVAPGRYRIYGRFYLYFDPVVSIDVTVTAPDGTIPCVENACGNGCGYVHACGDADPPLICPTVCVSLCECPPGWGITPAGDCEACPPAECCPRGALCGPLDLPPCPTGCCLPGDECPATVPACEPECCPADARCIPGIPPCDQPPRECCPAGRECPADLPPCELECCPPNARCFPEIPPCPTDGECCGPEGACVPDVPPCPVDGTEVTP